MLESHYFFGADEALKEAIDVSLPGQRKLNFAQVLKSLLAVYFPLILQEKVEELLEGIWKIDFLKLSQILAQDIINTDFHHFSPFRFAQPHPKHPFPHVGQFSPCNFQPRIAEFPVPHEDEQDSFFDLIVFFFEVAEIAPKDVEFLAFGEQPESRGQMLLHELQVAAQQIKLILPEKLLRKLQNNSLWQDLHLLNEKGSGIFRKQAFVFVDRPHDIVSQEGIEVQFFSHCQHRLAKRMLADTGSQYFHCIGLAFLVVEESLEQPSVLVLPESDCQAVSAILYWRVLEVFEDGEAVVADPLIKRAQTDNDVLCDLDFDAQSHRYLPRNSNFHVLPAEVCKSVRLFWGCLVDLTGLAVDMHFELDCIASSGAVCVHGFLSGRVSAWLLKEQPHVLWAGCDVDRVLLILLFLLAL